MVDFEIIEPEPQQSPALQLALDRLAQQRAADQSALQDWQLWADTQPPTLTYLGQSNGQPLLQSAGGQPFRAGSRDSNGSLSPGLADVAIGSGVVRVGGMPRVQEQPVEESTPQQKIAILFAKTTASTIEFWLGGDRTEPIKVTEIPRFGRSFPLQLTLSGSATHAHPNDTDENSGGVDSAGGRTGADVYQPYFYRSSTGYISGNGSGNVSNLEAFTFGNIGASATVGGATPLSLYRVEGYSMTPANKQNSFSLSVSISDSKEGEPPEPAAFYREPRYRLEVDGSEDLLRLSGSVSSLGGVNTESGVPIEVVVSTTMTFNGSVSTTLQEVNQYRAYLSVTPTTALVTIGYDIRAGGLENVLHFAVTSEVLELGAAQETDWRRSLATSTVLPPPASGNPAPDFPSSGNSCFDRYRRNYTTNVYQNRLYEVENGWNQPVVVDGSTFYLHDAIGGATPVKVKLLVRALTDAGDSCQVGKPQPIEMEVQPLRLSGEVTFIAACAAKD